MERINREIFLEGSPPYHLHQTSYVFEKAHEYTSGIAPGQLSTQNI